MDANWFDTLTKSVSRPGTRRRLVQLVTALPLAGAMGGLLAAEHADGQSNGAGVGGGGGRRQRRRGRHHPGQDKNNRKGKDKKACAKAGQTPQKGKRKGCCQGLSTDASGRCVAPAPGPTPDSCTGLKPTGSSPTQGLQEAIDGAQSGDTIRLCAGTWNLSAAIDIDKDLTLMGAGADSTALDGNHATRVLRIESGVTVTLQDVTITRGKSLAGVGLGGGILNLGTLSLLGVRVTGNTAQDGGGIYNSQGQLTLGSGSHVSDSTASEQGGGITNFGTLTLQAGSRVTGNSCTGVRGGGIYSGGGTLTLQAGSQVSGNSSSTQGGGIYYYGFRGTLTLQAGSQVSDNTAVGDGGGIYSLFSPVTIEADAIICGNSAPQCGGPGSFSGTCPNPRDGICPS